MNHPDLPAIGDPQLKLEALTHGSYSNEHPGTPSYDRLEFLGDAVLGFLVGQILFERYPHFTEAELSRLRAQLVNQNQLAYLARFLEIGPEIRLSRSLARDDGQDNPSILADVFESWLGASFLDAGLETVRDFVEELFIPILEQWEQSQDGRSPKPSPTVDIKNMLQQWALEKTKQLPEYTLIDTAGPPHAREFTFTVSVSGKVQGKGSGPSKQMATKQAALDALKNLGLL
ncbi:MULTISPECIES: ribonuclease III [unclassified Synechocystis]|uniref:ribonuclease III n=1 Tax=unclassified Synechocystis TaxID=2640012 RepID=UPI0003FB7820|nr:MULTISPECIES: ribonuclease III [unclassified Synechocystis]AIE73592.1 Ribonuclease III [Synechocystis sp. PCC 6714]MCT0254958.1 ribonuclease III [Synechocystis sp. CS-94]